MNPLLQRAKDEVAKTQNYHDEEPFKDWENFVKSRDYDDIWNAWDEVAELYAKYSREEVTEKYDIALKKALDNVAKSYLKEMGEVKECLKGYMLAQMRMLEIWADGDENVKAEIWKSLHAQQDKAMEILQWNKPQMP